MSWDKHGRSRCDYCYKYALIADSYTPFGCADPTDPEPYDPTDICGRCSEKDYQKWLQTLSAGSRHGNWCKSNGEVRAAKECGLVWVGNTGTLRDVETGSHVMNRYILETEKHRYVPYLTYPLAAAQRL